MIEELLLPISEDKICGNDLRYTYDYDQLKELRREDDARLSQGVWQIEPKKADWKEVKRVCISLLKDKTKDLQIAMWFLESAMVLQQFVGFNLGISLIFALCEKFWDNIYPSVDWENRSFTSRLSPFYFLAEKAQERLILIPITSSIDGTSYNLSDWITARHNFQIKNNNGTSLKQLKKTLLATPFESLSSANEEINLAIHNLNKLNDFLNEKCKDEAPSFGGIFAHLNDIKHIISQAIAEQSKIIIDKKSSARPIQQDTLSIEENVSMQQAKPTLEQAYKALGEISVFLEQEQPQSPASILLKIASAIGKKNFQELLEINLKNGISVMNMISELYRLLIPEPLSKQ
ncbi:MAG: type VI secretion system protein TssA [Holosporaceae bacterium]|jgi:type VI secretion system protein ImpA|nr:type VI secretion system protein TssA [Holosporaceae bacterium]